MTDHLHPRHLRTKPQAASKPLFPPLKTVPRGQSAARPHNTYRGSRPHDQPLRRNLDLKALRLARGMTRREMDRERGAMVAFITDGTVRRNFTEGQLMKLTTQHAMEAMRNA
jgi:hypothetical protein